MNRTFIALLLAGAALAFADTAEAASRGGSHSRQGNFSRGHRGSHHRHGRHYGNYSRYARSWSYYRYPASYDYAPRIYAPTYTTEENFPTQEYTYARSYYSPRYYSHNRYSHRHHGRMHSRSGSRRR